jgi:hypothetical protein
MFILEIICFEDDFEDRSIPDTSLIHGVDVLSDEYPIAAERLTDVDDHVDFGRAVPDGLFRLRDLDSRCVIAVRKTDDGADFDIRPFQCFLAHCHGIGFDAYGGNIVALSDIASMENVRVGHGGVEQGMVDHFGEIFEGRHVDFLFKNIL